MLKNLHFLNLLNISVKYVIQDINDLQISCY